jgi:hypothetical protein
MRIRKPSPAMAVALLALFIALGGTAYAAAVPLAKRALVADNAKKLGGRTPAQVISAAASQPGPASSAAGLVTNRSAQFTLAPGQAGTVTIQCQSGERAISGGFTTPDVVGALDTAPTSDGAGWQIFLANFSDTAPASGNLVVVCLR